MPIRTFITADLHLWHKKILHYEDRGFDTLEDMHEGIIKNWNAVVGKDDKIIIAGDMTFGNFAKTESVMSRLHGRKTLVKGNHDGHSDTWFRNCGIERIIPGGWKIYDFLWISHEPMYMNKHMPYINAHGHIHSQIIASEQYINVGLDRWNLRPIPLDDVLMHGARYLGVEVEVHAKLKAEMDKRHDKT